MMMIDHRCSDKCFNEQSPTLILVSVSFLYKAVSVAEKDLVHSTCGLVAMTSAQHAEGRKFDTGQVYNELSHQFKAKWIWGELGRQQCVVDVEMMWHTTFEW